MTRPRRQLIAVEDTPYYHCVSRCVRRAYLCGSDEKGNCFEHRRQWIVNRFKQLAGIFAIDVAAYAVMNNHYHLVLRIDSHQARYWSDTEVINRWLELCKGPDIIHRHRAEPLTSEAEMEVVNSIIQQWRERLSSISWFMKCLNEYIARKANREDRCTGHFWEARFKSQALLDQTALLACMVYVDLNPIRAGMTQKPEDSDYTSVQERLGKAPRVAEEPKKVAVENAARLSKPLAELLPFAGWQNEQTNPKHLPCALVEYLELVDFTGRCIRTDKRGAIPKASPRLLQRINLSSEKWLFAATGVEVKFHQAIGPLAKITQLCERLQQNWIQGQQACRQLYSD